MQGVKEVAVSDFEFQNWLPMEPAKGPPLPRFFNIFWPWYEAEKPPLGEYLCPYCPAVFDSYETLVSHVQTEHPGERIPLPIEWE